SALVTPAPSATMAVKSGSSASSQRTSTCPSAVGVTRVQRITRSVNGSPEATPWLKSAGTLLMLLELSEPSEQPIRLLPSSGISEPAARALTRVRRLKPGGVVIGGSCYRGEAG